MSDDRRVYRVAQAIREKLAGRLVESSDHRLSLVTITGVKVTKDLRIASIYWVHSGSKERIPEIESAFSGAKGYFRTGIAEGLKLRHVPDLRFFYDDTLDTVARIDALMERKSVSGKE